MQLLHLRSTDDSSGSLVDWVKKSGKYTSHDSQNELLHIMAMNVLRNIIVHKCSIIKVCHNAR